jgi:hypothetical protein
MLRGCRKVIGQLDRVGTVEGGIATLAAALLGTWNRKTIGPLSDFALLWSKAT